MVCPDSTRNQVEKALQRIENIPTDHSLNTTAFIDQLQRMYNHTQPRFNSHSEHDRHLGWLMRPLYILFFDDTYLIDVKIEQDMNDLGSWTWSDEVDKYAVRVKADQDEIINNRGGKGCNDRCDALISSSLSQFIQVYLNVESCYGECGDSDCKREHDRAVGKTGYGWAWRTIAVHIERTMKEAELGWFKPYLDITNRMKAESDAWRDS